MANPIDQIVFQQFNQFYETYKSASLEKNPEKREVLVNALFQQQEELLENAKSAKNLPRTLTGNTYTLKTLSDALSAKITSLLSVNDLGTNTGKEIPGSSSQRISLKGPGFGPKRVFINGCVGFGNKSNGDFGIGNCWANAVLKYLFHAPYLLQIPTTLGNFYAKGNTPNSVRSTKIHDLFKGSEPLSANAREKGIALFKKITSDYWKLKTLEALIQSEKPALAWLLLNTLPDESSLKQRWAKLRMEQSANNTLKMLLTNEEGAEKIKQNNMKRAGQYLLDAIRQYNLCRTAPDRGEQPRYVHEDVSQNVRIALHYISEGRISPTASDYEDAFDALGIFTDIYYEIAQLYDRVPPGYFHLEERTRFAVKNTSAGETDLRPISSINRSALEPGNIHRETTYNPQLILRAPDSLQDATIEDLFGTYFESDTQGDSAYFLHKPDGVHTDGIHEQNFEPNHVWRKFLGEEAPPSLSIVIGRYGQRPVTHQLYKILSRVVASRFITLPANATDKNVPLAYELTAFFVHKGNYGGGHYIFYIKNGEQWIECDDDDLRTVSNDAIDAILRCRTTTITHTPYVLHYRLVPPAQQQAMLALSATLRQVDPLPGEQPPPPPKTDPAPKNANLKTQQQFVDQLEQLQKLLQGTASNEEIREEIRKVLDELQKTSQASFSTLLEFIAISEGMKDADYVRNLLLYNPRKVLKITGSWFRPTSDNIVDQFLLHEREKLAILRLNTTEKPDSVELTKLKKQYVAQNLRAFLALLQDDHVTNKQQLIAAFNKLFIPKNIRDTLLERLEKAHGVEKRSGKELFEKMPWAFLQSAKGTPLLKDEAEDPWDQFEDLSLEARTTSILEEAIEQLQK
jgi:hypothetical protein